MKLSDDEKKEFLEDGRSIKRRDAFRSAPRPPHPATFEEYIAILDEMALLAPHPARLPLVRYTNVKL